MPITLTVVLSDTCEDRESQRLISQLSLLNEVVSVTINDGSFPSKETCPHGTPLNKPCGACNERARQLGRTA